MEKYNSYSYIYPPRPEIKIPPDILNRYDDGRYLAMPKYNGFCTTVFMDEKFLKVMNRHKEEFSPSKLKTNAIDFTNMHRGKGFMVLCGEILNSSKKNEENKIINNKFIIWDILVFDGKYLLGSKFEERMKLLNSIYPPVKGQPYKHMINIGSENIFLAPCYNKDFYKLYNEFIKTDVYEGVVLKRKDGKLEYGFREKNNTSWMVKARKATKNYHY